jgi:3-oxoadipate enol-lactonase
MLLSLNGRRIAYDLIGSETAPVVCFTHSLAADGGMWAEQIPSLLAAGFRVLRLDMRGHGGSEPLPRPYTMSQLAGDIAAALGALEISRVHYIGLSIGGMIGQAFALEHGDRLISAMWCDTLPASPQGAEAAWAERISTVQAARSLAPLADATVERWLTDDFKRRSPNRWKQIRETVAATTPDGYLGCADAILGFDFTPRLASLRVPLLVVCGDQDPGTPPEQNRKIAGLVPGARYEPVANAKHFPNVEDPDAFNRIMIGWLESQRHRS